MARSVLASLALAGVVLWAAPLRAEPSAADRAAATELFKQARDLMTRERYAEACPKFAESHRLDPGGGTVLNLGLCYEAQGKLATAWTTLNEALSSARRDRREDREVIATEHIAAIEPRLSRIAIVVPADAATAVGLQVLRDGTLVGTAAWGAALPVDPGKHRIEARAPGHKPWSATVEIDEEGQVKTVSVDRLERFERAERPSKASPKPVVAASLPARTLREPDRTAAYLLGGAGLAAVSVGAVFGLLAIRSYGSADDACPTHSGCSDEAISSRDRAGTQALIANLCIAGGALATGAAVYLWLDPVDSAEPSPTGFFRGVSLAGQF